MTDGTERSRVLPKSHIWNLAVSVKEPQFLVAGGNSGYLTYMNLNSSKLVELSSTNKSKADVCSVGISDDAKWVAAGGSDGRITIWETSTNRMIHQTPILANEEPCYVRSLTFYADNSFLAIGIANGFVYEISTATWKEKQIGQFDSSIASLAISHDSRLVGIGLWDGTISIWNRPDKKKSAQMIDTVHPDAIIGSLIFDPKGEKVFSGSVDATFRCWELQTSKLLLRIALEYPKSSVTNHNKD